MNRLQILRRLLGVVRTFDFTWSGRPKTPSSLFKGKKGATVKSEAWDLKTFLQEEFEWLKPSRGIHVSTCIFILYYFVQFYTNGCKNFRIFGFKTLEPTALSINRFYSSIMLKWALYWIKIEKWNKKWFFGCSWWSLLYWICYIELVKMFYKVRSLLTYGWSAFLSR